MSVSNHPELAWSQVQLDPALAKLAGVEESCLLPIWSGNAGDGVPGDPAEHDTTELVRGLAVGFGQGPKDSDHDWPGLHAALLEALTAVRGFSSVEELLRSIALDFRRDGYRREAVEASRTAVRLCPDSAVARSQLIVAVWFLLGDQLDPNPEQTLTQIRELFPGLGDSEPENPRVRDLVSYAYLVAEFFVTGRLDEHSPEVQRAEGWLRDPELAERIDRMERRGFVDLRELVF